jgi:hypothetical protein
LPERLSGFQGHFTSSMTWNMGKWSNGTIAALIVTTGLPVGGE